MSEVRLIDANALPLSSIDITDLPDYGGGSLLVYLKEDVDNAPTIVSDEAIVLDFTNITEEQKQQLVNLLSKTRIKAINKDVIWQNGYYACLNDKSIRESNWIPVSEKLPDIAKKCIVQLTDGHITIGSYHSIDKWTFQETNVRYAYPKESVIAWQPLPEPYKEAEND